MQNTRRLVLFCVCTLVLAVLSTAVLAQGGGDRRNLVSWAVTERFYDISAGDKIASGLFMADRYFINNVRFISPGNKLANVNGPLEIPQIVLLERPFIFEPMAGQPTTFTTILKNGQWYKINLPSITPPVMQMPVWDFANKAWRLGNPPAQ